MDNDTLIIFGAAFVCVASYWLKYKRRKPRRFWVNPYLRNRSQRSRYGDVCTKYYCTNSKYFDFAVH